MAASGMVIVVGVGNAGHATAVVFVAADTASAAAGADRSHNLHSY